MKISALIKALEAAREEHGDAEVHAMERECTCSDGFHPVDAVKMETDHSRAGLPVVLTVQSE